MQTPLSDPCQYWVDRFGALSIPVLTSTHQALLQWRNNMDRANANALSDIILRDPLMTLRLLIHVSEQTVSRLATQVETVTASLVLLGIEPFFKAFEQLPLLEEQLAALPRALAGAQRALHRAHRAARFAAAFAVHRQDDDVEVLHQAALLDNFSGLLLWCAEPWKALRMAQRQHNNHQLRSADVQRAVLGVDLDSVEAALMAHWQLPPILREMAHPAFAMHSGPQSVALAVRIARHSQDGWDNLALPDDFLELGHLLNLSAMAAEALVREIDEDQ